jgi:hypothetical protein
MRPETFTPNKKISIMALPRLLSGLRVLLMSLVAIASFSQMSHAGIIFGQFVTETFGTGANRFSMKFFQGLTSPPRDTNGTPNPAGGVPYQYATSIYEISEIMIDKYNGQYGISRNQVITKDTRGPQKPATNVTWIEAAHFVNWLNIASGTPRAYKLNNSMTDRPVLWTPSDILDYDPNNPLRSKRTLFALPSADEWYQAAFLEEASFRYQDYPSERGNVAPTAVASGRVSFTAVYDQAIDQGPADVHLAGGENGNKLIAMGGNVDEWEESPFDQTTTSTFATRGLRGGAWSDSLDKLSSTNRRSASMTSSADDIGFRVVRLGPIPEPSMMSIAASLGLGGYFMRKRQRK